MQFKYGLTVIAPKPSLPQATPQPQPQVIKGLLLSSINMLVGSAFLFDQMSRKMTMAVIFSFVGW